jgi:DNA replicative helicase MCM subunit Mcm2 (Cdc46/Mcm family)
MVPFVQALAAAVEFAKRLGPIEIVRDEEARRLWHEVYGKLSKGGVGMFGAVTGRAEAQVMRLALLYALLGLSEVITRAHLVAALELWRYSEESARFIWGDRLGDQDVDDLLAAIRQAPLGLTRAEISDQVFGHHRSADQIERALAVLERLGLVRRQVEHTAGRPAERWIATTGLPAPSHSSLSSQEEAAVHPDERKVANEANDAKKPPHDADCLACAAGLPCWEHKPPF